MSTTRLHSERVRATTTRRARRRRASPTGAPTLWFAAPALLIYALIVIYPSLGGAYYAFTDWSGIGAYKWIGLENFKTLFSDDQSFGSLVNTIKLTVFIVIVQNAVGLALALGVHTRIKSKYVLRTIFFAPAVLSARW